MTRETHVALLRGINLGANNRITMKVLCALFADLGCANVRHYIQSGNIAFEVAPGEAARIASGVSQAIAAGHGFNVPIVTRSAAELEAIALALPYPGDEDVTHVMFLDAHPSAERVALLDPRRSPPDTFHVRGREVYLRCPDGLARTKLSNAYFDKTLATISTARNWRTLQALISLAQKGAD